jgi:DHA2 family multidrug resistance protein-like MFS transporter
VDYLARIGAIPDLSSMKPNPAIAYDGADGLLTPQRYLAMAVILLGLSMAVLDSAIVNLALPRIVRDFHADAAAAIWVVTAYQVAILVLLLPCAMLGDLLGHRRVYLTGLTLFTAASLACALSTSLPMLIAARVAQGLGAAGLMAVNGALVRFTYPARQLGRGIALNSIVVATASVAGPSIAAVVLSVASWPWLFAVNLPIGIAVVALGARALPRRTAVANPAAGLSPLDALLNIVMFGLIFLGVDALGARVADGDSRLGPKSGAVIALAGLAVGVFYMRRQRRLEAPLFPLDLLRIPVFALSMCTSIAAFAAQTLAFVSLPFLLLEAYGRSPAATGLLLTAWPIATVVSAPLAGRLIGRVADGLLGAVGLGTMAIGLALMAELPASPSDIDVVWRLAICGFGFGLFQSPNNHTILTTAPRSRSGAASGMLGTARLTGQAFGAVLLASIFGAVGANTVHGPSFALGLAAGFAGIAGAFSGLRVRTSAETAGVAHASKRP